MRLRDNAVVLWYDLGVTAILDDVLQPIQEAAARFGVSDDKLYRLIRERKIAKYRREGDRRTFVDEEQVRTALGFRRVSGPEPGEDT